jgi:hypothetical protein
MKTVFKKITTAVLFACLVISMTSCSFVSKALKNIDEKENERITNVLNEKASEYGIDAGSAEVMQGGQYFKVLIDSPNTLDKIKDLVILHRKWQKFTYAECKNRKFSVTFYDREHQDISYGGFSDQDQGFDAEVYFADYHIFLKFIDNIRLYTSPTNKKAKWTPEEFYEMTGISTEMAEEFSSWFSETFASRKDEKPDPSEHDITFIPGDTIMHREKFVIGDEKCRIPAGTYTLDVTQKHGIIHITDSEGNIKYRFDGDYRDGHSDALYEYTPLPAKITLYDGDILYTTNCASTFDRVDESGE